MTTRAGRWRASWAVGLANRAGLHYGWLVVGVVFLTLLVASGVRQAPGVVIKPLEAEFGWDRASISLAVAISLLVGGLASPYSGQVMDRFGPRSVLLGGALLTIVGGAAMLTVGSLLELSLWWGLVIGLSSGALTVVLGASVANRWFVARRGFVVGLFSAGWSAGQFVFIPLMMGLTLAFGWRSALLLLVGVMAVLVLPLALVLMRNQPSDVGQRAYGADRASADAVAAAADTRITPPFVAMRTADFWLLAGSYFVCGFTTNGLIGTHLIPHAVEHGFTEEVAAGAMATLGLMNIVGTTAAGWLTDRYDPRRLLAFIYGFRALGLLLLPWVSDLTSLSVFVVIYGLDWIATVPPTVALTADRFGRRSIGLLFGWISLSHQVGGAVASYAGGLARVWLGDYQTAFLAAAVMAFIAAAICQWITPPSRVATAPAT